MFEFDPAKSAINAEKHGIDFDEAQALWQDEKLLLLRSKSDREDEERWLAIGWIDNKDWTAIFTRRDNNIRLISVRRSRPREKAVYGDQDN